MKNILVIILLFITFNIAKSQKINSSIDEFTGKKQISLTKNELKDSRFSFNSYEVINKEDTICYVQIEYIGSDWVFIETGNSLILLIDGNNETLNTVWREETEIFSGFVYESQQYVVKKDLFEKISKAKEIKVRIIGKYFYDTKFTENTFSGIKMFLSKIK